MLTLPKQGQFLPSCQETLIAQMIAASYLVPEHENLRDENGESVVAVRTPPPYQFQADPDERTSPRRIIAAGRLTLAAWK